MSRPVNKYDTFWHRFFAGFIDGLIFLPFGIIDFFMKRGVDGFLIFPWLIISYSAFFVYSIYFHWTRGQTIGKKMMGVKVVDVSEEKLLTLKQAIMRDSVYAGLQIVALILVIINIVHYQRYTMTIEEEALGGLLPFVGQAWFILEVVTMLTNDKRRAFHDFMAGSVCVLVMKEEMNQES